MRAAQAASWLGQQQAIIVRSFDDSSDRKQVIQLQARAFQEPPPLPLPFLNEISYSVARSTVIEALNSKLKDPNTHILVCLSERQPQRTDGEHTVVGVLEVSKREEDQVYL